ncbi:MAG TPA: homocysteine S-methyltransferase family protein [Dehalococcoidia bacterium]|nr:homocysteine S-methyltransferase family protein [Dehalococcoidia bacterium]
MKSDSPSSLIECLKAARVLVADGATGTNYQLMGLEPGRRPEDWVFAQPHKVKTLHHRFIEAGAQIILTNSFGGSPLRLKDSPYGAAELNRRAAQLALEAVAESGKRVLVAGSMGPIGQLLHPLGPLSPEEATNGFAEQAAALAEGGVDFLLAETMFDLREAQAAIEGARRATALPIVCSFSFDQGTRTLMGLRPRDVIQGLDGAGLAAIGLNCGHSLEESAEVVKEMAQALQGRLPLWCKPNAGLPSFETGAATYRVTPQQMARWTLESLRLGARIVGGCCGTTPEHVAAIARAVASYRAGEMPADDRL